MADRTEQETPASDRYSERTQTAGTQPSTTQFSMPPPSLMALGRALHSLSLSFVTLPFRAVARATGSVAASTDVQSSRSTETGRADAPSPADRETVPAGGDSDTSAVDPAHPLLGVNPELLNPERRILQLLISEGGMLPQSEIVERTRWSASTVSRALCRMETQGRIERYRRGTGNLVVLPQNRED